MKRTLIKACGLLLILLLFSAGCQVEAKKNTLAPYPLTESQWQLLDYLNLRNTANLVSFHTPEEALSITVTCYVLENGNWVENGGGSIMWDGQDSDGPTNGVLTMIYREDRRFDINLSAQGTSSFQSKPVASDGDLTASSHSWLGEEQEIQLDQEIPVALFAETSGNTMASFTTDTYFTPEDLQGLDLVQAVTLTFSDLM